MATMLIIVEDNTIQACQAIFLLWWPIFEHSSTGIKLGFCFRKEILFLFFLQLFTMNIHRHLFHLLLFLLFIITGFAHCSRHQSQYLSGRNVTTSKIDAFYDSTERIAATFNDRFAEIASEIRAISEGQLSISNSICYRSIVQVLESGYRYEWSAKSKFFKIKMGF